MKRLPNNFGSVQKLSGKRRRPYMARTANKKVIGYAPTREEALILLSEYNKTPWNVDLRKSTLEDVWKMFEKTERDNYSEHRWKAFQSAYRKLEPYYHRCYSELKSYHFMTMLDEIDTTKNVKNNIISLLKHLDDVAFKFEIIDKKFAHELKGYQYEAKSKRKPFTTEEIHKLWEHQDEDFVDLILIMIYTGFRVSEIISITRDNVDFETNIITAGVKTKAGKNRHVPICSKILPLVKKRLDGDYKLYENKYQAFGNEFRNTMKRLGMDHIPHECRHTLRTLLDNVGANKVCIDRILGHKSGDTGMDIYTHKTDEQLKTEIEKLTTI